MSPAAAITGALGSPARAAAAARSSASDRRRGRKGSILAGAARMRARGGSTMRTIARLAALALILACPLAAQAPPAPDPGLVERARKILDRAPLVDGHNDVPWQVRERFGDHLSKLD